MPEFKRSFQKQENWKTKNVFQNATPNHNAKNLWYISL